MLKRNLLPVLILMIVMTAILSGCGQKEQALETYKENMSVFCENVITANDTINSIDPSSEASSEELLAALDSIEQEFKTLADMEVPEQFSAVESLADEAGAYMTEAVGLYHQAFESEEYDESYLTLASESYQRAIKRVQYIGDILMGTIPDDENVEVSYEDERNTNKKQEPSSEAASVPNTEANTEASSEALSGESE